MRIEDQVLLRLVLDSVGENVSYAVVFNQVHKKLYDVLIENSAPRIVLEQILFNRQEHRHLVLFIKKDKNIEDENDCRLCETETTLLRQFLDRIHPNCTSSTVQPIENMDVTH